MSVHPIHRKTGAVAVVIADSQLVDTVRERLAQRDMTILASSNYGEIAAHLAPDTDRNWPTLGLVLVDARSSLGHSTMLQRLHMTSALLREHAESGETWPAVVLLIDSQQTDPAWLAAYPIAHGLIDERDDITTMILNPWDDGSWAAQIHHAVDAALPLHESSVLAPA